MIGGRLLWRQNRLDQGKARGHQAITRTSASKVALASGYSDIYSLLNALNCLHFPGINILKVLVVTK